ncbi:MAG: VCBS repeat-containing protein, partial [Planctomycetes bacterium]|nr:VCBS repeat-containing protein [Planctomycetota bacterium]
GDGDADLVLGIAGQNRLYVNSGSGAFTDLTAGRLPAINDNTRSIALGDIDGDGDFDLIVGNHNQQARLLQNNGLGTFADITATNLPVLSGPVPSVAFGDVDGDLDLDLVVGIYYQQSRLLLNNGSGTFVDATATNMPGGIDLSYAVALGDVDGDGDLDLVVGNYYYGGAQNRLLLNNGSGAFTDVTGSNMPGVLDPTFAIALGDVDGDGDLDLVAGNYYYYGSRNRLLLNNGGGTFSDVTAAAMPPVEDATYAVALTDVDGDGDPDLVVGNGGEDALYLNLHAQIHTPFVLRPGHPFEIVSYVRNSPIGAVDAALPFLSLTRVSIPVPPWGTLGATPDAPLGFFPIPQATGFASFTWNVPNIPAFAGLQVYAQALIVRSTGGGQLTNLGCDEMMR